MQAMESCDAEILRSFYYLDEDGKTMAISTMLFHFFSDGDNSCR